MPIVPLYPRGEVSPRPLPDAATGELTALRDEVFGEAANGTQRRRLGPILDVHFAVSTADITRHAVAQQDVYVRGVATAAIETSRAEAIADPTMMDNALFRAEDAARALHAGQPPEAVEAGVRAAGGSVIAGVIVDRLARNDPLGASLFRQYADRLDPADRRTLGAAAETLSNTLGADAWLHERSAALSPLTGAAALDAVNAASASTTEPSSVASSNGTLLDQDGIVGTRERLAEIEDRRSALTALNQQEFAANPARLRANQAAIDTDTARSRAAVKAETDALYTDLRRHLTTGGPNGGPAITLPPATIMSRLTEVQRDAVTAQVNGAIEGRSTSTDPQTWYAIRQGLTGDDADERQRWASKNLVPFMDRLSTEAEAYATVYDLKDTAIKSGWLEVIDPGAFPIVASHRRSLDDVLPFTADEIAGMRRTLAEGTAEQRAAVLAQYQALPENMKDPVAERLVPRAAEPSVMSDAADEELQDGEQYAQVNLPRLGGREGRPSALTARQEMELQFYRSKLDTIRLLEPQNRLLPGVAPENAPISRRQMEEIDRELVEVRARAAQRDLEREERERGETTSEPLPSADDLVRSTVPGGALSRSMSRTPDRAERGTPSEAPCSIVQTLQDRELAKTRVRFHLSHNSLDQSANTEKSRQTIRGIHRLGQECKCLECLAGQHAFVGCSSSLGIAKQAR